MSQNTFMTRLLERLSEEEARVWEVLQDHRGKAAVITNAELARQAEVDERLVRWCVKSLTEDHRKPIGSLPGLGVFVIDTPEERDEVLSFYKGHALSLLRRMCILSNYGTSHMVGQIRLDLEQLERELSRN